MVAVTWRDCAACRDADPSIFFLSKGGSSEPARLICAACPVLPACDDYAVSLGPELKGIWAGRTDRERSSGRSRPPPSPRVCYQGGCGHPEHREENRVYRRETRLPRVNRVSNGETKRRLRELVGNGWAVGGIAATLGVSVQTVVVQLQARTGTVERDVADGLAGLPDFPTVTPRLRCRRCDGLLADHPLTEHSGKTG